MGNDLKKVRLFILLFAVFICFSLVGCGSEGSSVNKIIVNTASYKLEYNGNVKLGKVALKTDDLNEIVDIYQEIGDDVGYRDSLLIAEKYSQGLGVNAFAQDNLDMLNERGLVLSDVKKTQIQLRSGTGDINAVLVDYKIIEGFISSVPELYVSQLFIPDNHDIRLISYITEDSSSHSYAVNMLKNIR